LPENTPRPLNFSDGLTIGTHQNTCKIGPQLREEVSVIRNPPSQFFIFNSPFSLYLILYLPWRRLDLSLLTTPISPFFTRDIAWKRSQELCLYRIQWSSVGRSSSTNDEW
jgi:hypothetical protein